MIINLEFPFCLESIAFALHVVEISMDKFLLVAVRWRSVHASDQVPRHASTRARAVPAYLLLHAFPRSHRPQQMQSSPWLKGKAEILTTRPHCTLEADEAVY